MNRRGFRWIRLRVLLIALGLFVVCAGLAAIPTGTGSQGGSTSTLSHPFAYNNVQFYYGPLGSPAFVNQVEIFKGGNGWAFTSSHRYAWASTSNGAVYISVPKGERVLDLYADYGTSATPTFSNIAWNPAQRIPLTRKLKAPDGRTYVIRLAAVEGEMYSRSLPLVPCADRNKC